MGTFLLTDRPQFTWTPVEDATTYQISIFEPGAGFRHVEPDKEVPAPPWTPEDPLPRGRIFQWKVTAIRDRQQVVAASSPAYFMILEANEAQKLEAQARRAGSPLTRALLLAEAGVLDGAQSELEKLDRAKPASPVVRALLEEIRRRRPGGS